MYKLLFLFVILLFKLSHGAESWGKCPNIEPMPEFNMNKFLGHWYAIQETDSPGPCLSYYITEEKDNYKITQVVQNYGIGSSAIHLKFNITGELTVPDQKQPGIMNLDFFHNILADMFTILMTDYDNYAALFTCGNYPFLHHWHAKIFSRTPTLDKAFLDKIRTRLSNLKIDSNLNTVSQDTCFKPETNVISDPKTNENTEEQLPNKPEAVDLDVGFNIPVSSYSVKNIRKTISFNI